MQTAQQAMQILLNIHRQEGPKSLEALSRLVNPRIEKVHDDGDLTLRSEGKLYVVTTDGQLFEQK